MANRYVEARARREKPIRVVVLMPRQELDAMDDWAIRQGIDNRSGAVRKLIGKGLSAEQRATA
jgi:metal-responsive CopG/Arc/MetJ family transcriptional regulator